MTSEAQKRAVKKYKQSKAKRITIDFSAADEYLLDHINRQTKKQTYIKNLIKNDMALE